MKALLILMILALSNTAFAMGKHRPAPAPEPTVPSTYPGPYLGDPSFSPKLEKFLSDAKIFNQDFNTTRLTIRFGDLTEYGARVIGLCESGGGQAPRVTINQAFWDRVDDTQKMLLLHHELGHCLLGRGHTTKLMADGNPESIMYPSIFSNALFHKYKSHYLQELFTETLVEDVPAIHVCEAGDSLVNE